MTGVQQAGGAGPGAAAAQPLRGPRQGTPLCVLMKISYYAVIHLIESAEKHDDQC